MNDNKVSIKIVRCDSCDYEWHVVAPSITGWLQTAFKKTVCPRCQTDYTGLDIYPDKDLDLRVSLHDDSNQKKIKGRW